MNLVRWAAWMGMVVLGAVSPAQTAPLPTSNQSAVVGTNRDEARPVMNKNTPAYRAAAHFQHGVNLGNYLEVPPGQKWKVSITTNDFDYIREEGFDHVRVPVGWHHYAGPGPEFKLSDEIFAKVDFVLTNALARKLAVMINIHHFNEFTSDPVRQTDKFLAIWWQIAEHYAGLPDTVVFELLNEPKDMATTKVVNPIFKRAIVEIRKTNPQRTIVVGGGKWNSIDELKNLELPEDDNLLVTVHCYDPFYFTHQGAGWAGPEVKTTGIIFPGPPVKPIVLNPTNDLKSWVTNWIDKYNTQPTAQNPSSPVAFVRKLKLAHQWSEYCGRPVYIGEFGCFTAADPVSRVNFYRAFRRAAEREKLGWAVWDWNDGFRYWDKQKQQPVPGMREALFSHD